MTVSSSVPGGTFSPFPNYYYLIKYIILILLILFLSLLY